MRARLSYFCGPPPSCNLEFTSEFPTKRHMCGMLTVCPLLIEQETPVHPPCWIDIAKLRSEHRICGILTGTLPHLSQQNVFLGPPLVLMPEEVVLLVEKGACAHLTIVIYLFLSRTRHIGRRPTISRGAIYTRITTMGRWQKRCHESAIRPGAS